MGRAARMRGAGAGARVAGKAASGATAAVRELPPAPPASRLYAYAIDWALGGIVTGAPAVVAYAALTHGSMLSTIYDFEASGYAAWLGIALGLACVLMGALYFVVIPWKVWPGQTPGKRVACLRVESADGRAASLGQLCVRQMLVGFLLEGSAFVAARYLREVCVLVTRVDVNYYWEIACMVLALVSAVLAFVMPARRALHDYVARTRVVPAEGHPLAE